jgi:hypothetical protein
VYVSKHDISSSIVTEPADLHTWVRRNREDAVGLAVSANAYSAISVHQSVANKASKTVRRLVRGSCSGGAAKRLGRLRARPNRTWKNKSQPNNHYLF